jgi:hypothetical protein
MMWMKLITGVHNVHQCQLEYINIVEMCVVNRRLLPAAAAPAVFMLKKYMLTLPGQLPIFGNKKKQDKQSAYHPGIFFSAEGVQQIQLRTEGRENVDLGAAAPKSEVPLNLQMSETHILIRFLWMYFPRTWEFGSALSKLRDFKGGVFEPPTLSTPLVHIT